MIGHRRFRRGQRVRLSALGRSRNIVPRTRHKFRGTVVRVDGFNTPTVQWDGRKTAQSYHPDFIDPVR